MYRSLHRHYRNKYHGQYRHAKKLFVFDLFLLSLSATLFVFSLFFYFWKPGTESLVELTIALDGTRLKSGDPTHLTIKYENRSKFSLTDVSLAVRLPPSFVINRTKTTEDAFSNNSIINIHIIEPGASNKIELYGTFWTTPKEDAKIVALLSFKKEGSNFREQKVSSAIINLPESAVTTIITVPQTAFPKSSIPFSILVKNNGAEKIDDISIVQDWPFKITNGDALATPFSLSSGEQKTMVGQLNTPEFPQNLNWKLKTQILVNGNPLTQSENNFKIDILSPALFSKASIISPASFAEPGETIPVKLQWGNIGKYKFENLKLRIVTTKGAVDLKETAKLNNLTIEGDDLIADKNTRTALGNAQPNFEDTFTIQIKLLPKFILGQVENASLKIDPTIEGAGPGSPLNKFIVPGEGILLPLATEIEFKAETRYYTPEGDQLGRGPLPPQVSEETKYWIFIKIFNSTNAIENASFSASLIEGVKFTGKQSVTLGSALKYDDKNRAISWYSPSIPPNSQVGLYFEVAVTPNSNQFKQILKLTNNLYFSAKDAFIGKEFSIIEGDLTNVLSENDRGQSAGAQVRATK